MSNQVNTKDTHSKEVKRAVCYLRVASVHQDSTEAIDAQREACERKAQELGVTIAHEYLDQGASGNTADRPALQAMLARLKSDPPISCVITYNLARLARNSKVCDQIIQTLDAAGVQVVTIDGTVGPGVRKFMQTLISAMAELDTQNRREIRRARRAAS